MKIGEAISYTRSLSGNAVDDNTLCRWLSELDGRLMLDFYKGSEWMSYALPQDEDHELLVPFPWDELYVHYLEAMVYYSNGEFERYRNSYEMYNKKELDYRQWYARNQLPVRLEALARRDCTVVTEGRGSKPFWYLSAYALAVKHGFQGTELEWLETLVGPTGSTGPQGDPAGFGTVDATVDTTSGTPAVQVTADGPNTAKNIHFSFTGLKGAKGDKGNKGDTGLAVGSVVKTGGTGAPGTTDTYTVYLTDNTPVGTITVYNGQDGAGDFKADGSVPMTGNLQMGNHKLTGLAEGTADTDGVNKGQMDEAIAALTGEDIPTSGTDETTIAAALSNKADKVTLLGNVDCNALFTPGDYIIRMDPATAEQSVACNLPNEPGHWSLSIYATLEVTGNNGTVYVARNRDSGNIYSRQALNESFWPWVKLATATPPQQFDLPLAEGVSGAIRYSKDQMGVVRLLGQVELATNQSGIIGIGTLPEGYYLGYAVATVCCGWPDGGANIAPCTAVVNEDGLVTINAFDASLKVFAVNISFC